MLSIFYEKYLSCVLVYLNPWPLMKSQMKSSKLIILSTFEDKKGEKSQNKTLSLPILLFLTILKYFKRVYFRKHI